MPAQLDRLESPPLLSGIPTLVAVLRKRGVPLHDAEEAVQDTLCWFWEQPEHRHCVYEFDQYRGLFVKAAMNRWLMRLRSERSRRERENIYADRDPERDLRASVSDPAELFFGATIEHAVALKSLLVFAGDAKLTALQVRYLQELVDGKSIKEIAAGAHTTTRAVNAVCARAGHKYNKLLRA